VDLKIYKKGHLKFLVSCKKTSTLRPIYISKSELKYLESKSREMRAKGLICFGFRRTPILGLPLSHVKCLPQSNLFRKLLPSMGSPLKEMLRRETQKTVKAGGQ